MSLPHFARSASTVSLRGRILVSEAVSPSQKARFLTTLWFGMTGEGGHCEPRFFVCEAISVFRVLGLLRCAHDVGFTPRNSQKRRFNATFKPSITVKLSFLDIQR